jgi:predicted kinase
LRRDAGALAQQAKVAFVGIWLDAPADILRTRVRDRQNDASDADLGVLETQLATDLGALTWHRLDASGEPEAVLEAASRLPVLAKSRNLGNG